MLNAHELNSYSRIAHAQRLNEASDCRLAKVAAGHPEEATRTPHSSWKTQLIAALSSRLRVARANA
jgi:hypothetical protein